MTLRRSDILFALSFAAAITLAWLLRQALLLIYASVILAIVLTPAVDKLRAWRLGRWQPGRGAGVLALILLVTIAAAALAVLAVPPLVREARTMAAEWPRRAQELAATLHRLPGGTGVRVADLQNSVANLFSAASTAVQGLGSSLAALLTLALLTAYFIADGRRPFLWALRIVRPHAAPRLLATLDRAEQRISRWIFGQLLLMFILASVDLVVYGLLGIHYTLALSVFAGLMNVVPVIGPLIGLVPAVLVAGTPSGAKLMAVLLFYGVYQEVDNSYITPRVMRATVQITPVAVIVALIIGAELGGILGALVAIPTAVLVEVLIEEYVVARPPGQAAPA